MSPAFNDQYQLGLSFLKKAIEWELFQAGANMTSDSVFSAKFQRNYSGVPANTSIAAVPLDAPKTVVEFTQEEVLDCSEGVNRVDIREKIRLYSSAYAKFRSSPERTVRHFANRRGVT